MKIFINSKNRTEPRQLVEAELLKDKETTIIVRLPDGTVVKRKKKRDLSTEIKE